MVLVEERRGRAPAARATEAMALSAFQKVALVSCVVLCCSVVFPILFLVRGKRGDPKEANPNRFPPMMRPKASDIKSSRSAPSQFNNAEAVVKAKAVGGGNKNIMGQIIPIYGFGIFVYILYILFKILAKGSSPQVKRKCATTRPGNKKRKITDYELAQLQERLKETEMAVEKIVSKMGSGSDEMTNVTTEQEQKLLQQLKEITRVMKEGKLIDGFCPETEAEEDPYMEDWEEYPEEVDHTYGMSKCRCQQNSSEPDQCSAENLEEQVEAETTEGFSNETVTKQTKEREDQAMGQKERDVLRLGEQRDVIQCDENNCLVEESQSGDYQGFNQVSEDVDQMENTGLSLGDCSDKAQEASSADSFCGKQQNFVKGTDRLRKRNKKVME